MTYNRCLRSRTEERWSTKGKVEVERWRKGKVHERLRSRWVTGGKETRRKGSEETKEKKKKKGIWGWGDVGKVEEECKQKRGQMLDGEDMTEGGWEVKETSVKRQKEREKMKT